MKRTPKVMTACAAAVISMTALAATPAYAAESVVFKYNFNDGNLNPVTDISGSGNNGVVKPNATALELVPGPGGSGQAVQFPAAGTAMIEAGAAGSAANPGTRDFRYGASVRLTAEQVTSGANIVQKGYASDHDQWKLQVDGGVPSCVVRVDDVRKIVSGPALRLGRWNTLECRKTGTDLDLYIGGVLAKHGTVPAGSIDDTGATKIRIGAKGLGTNNDQFRGSVDQPFLAVSG